MASETAIGQSSMDQKQTPPPDEGMSGMGKEANGDLETKSTSSPLEPTLEAIVVNPELSSALENPQFTEKYCTTGTEEKVKPEGEEGIVVPRETEVTTVTESLEASLKSQIGGTMATSDTPQTAEEATIKPETATTEATSRHESRELDLTSTLPTESTSEKRSADIGNTPVLEVLSESVRSDLISAERKAVTIAVKKKTSEAMLTESTITSQEQAQNDLAHQQEPAESVSPAIEKVGQIPEQEGSSNTLVKEQPKIEKSHDCGIKESQPEVNIAKEFQNPQCIHLEQEGQEHTPKDMTYTTVDGEKEDKAGREKRPLRQGNHAEHTNLPDKPIDLVNYQKKTEEAKEQPVDKEGEEIKVGQTVEPMDTAEKDGTSKNPEGRGSPSLAGASSYQLPSQASNETKNETLHVAQRKVETIKDTKEIPEQQEQDSKETVGKEPEASEHLDKKSENMGETTEQSAPTVKSEEISSAVEEPMKTESSLVSVRTSEASPTEELSKELPPQDFKPFSSYTVDGRLKESAVEKPAPEAPLKTTPSDTSIQSLVSTSQETSEPGVSVNATKPQDSARFQGAFLNFLKCNDDATEHSMKSYKEGRPDTLSTDSQDPVREGEEKSAAEVTDAAGTQTPKSIPDTTNDTSRSNQEWVSKPEVGDECSNLSRSSRKKRGKKEPEKKAEDGGDSTVVSAPTEDTGVKKKDSGFPADQLFEYQWPQDKIGEWFFLQEHLSAYLGVISFKRKYPDLQRRPVVMDERNFLMENGVVSEMQCDLGLTALKSDEVYEFMLKDFPEKYQAYAEVLHTREKQRITDKNKAYGEMAKMDKNKIDDLVKKAVRNAADFNAQFMRERREERAAYFDLQTHEIHYPLSTIKHLPPETTKISGYPVALIPGQFQNYYKKYTPQQLKYFPLMTATYNPPRRLKTIFADPADKYESELDSQSASSQVECKEAGDEADRKDEAEEGSSSSSGSSSGSESDGDSSSSSSEEEPEPPTPAPPSVKKSTRTPRGKKCTEEVPDGFVMPLAEMNGREAAVMCNICQGSADKNKIGEAEELVKCSECGRHGHPSCLELTEEMIPIIKVYPWQCMECKTCVECMDPYDEDKMMFCDHCDRGYHTFCVGLRSIPTGRWECPSCRPEPPAKKRKK